jgi:glycosyltransferase involved in cell wall biosynthesis
MKKILFVHHGEGLGGASVSLINTINSLDREKYIVSVLLIKKSSVVKLLSDNNINFTIAESYFYKKIYNYFIHSEVRVIPLYRLDILIKQLVSWLLSRYIFASFELNKLDFDLVHLNSLALTDWLAPVKKKSKVVIHIREPLAKGLIGLRYNFIRKEIDKYADKIISISIDNSNRINLKDKTTIVYNFMDIGSLDHMSDKGNGKVLYLGGDDLIKGYLNVVNTLDLLEPSIKILFCGNYRIESKMGYFSYNFLSALKNILPLQRKLNKAYSKIHSHPNASYIGLVTNVSELIAECEFLISPFDKPHFSRPIFEAFANRRTVIATNVEGMEEIISNGKDGIIVNRNNPIELANAITFLHKNVEIRKLMGINGYRKATKMFDKSNVLKIQNVYISLLE